MDGGVLSQKVRFARQLTNCKGDKKYLAVVKRNYCQRENMEYSWVLNFNEGNSIFTNTSERLSTAIISLDGG